MLKSNSLELDPQESLQSCVTISSSMSESIVSESEKRNWSWIKVEYIKLLDKVITPRTATFYLITWPDVAWSPKWYLTIRGAECLHIYLWIAKDWSWTQDWYYAGLLFGSAAVAWAVYLLFRAIRIGNYQEVYHGIAQNIWLFANLWWMQGELHDYMYPDEPTMIDRRQQDSGYMMVAALCWLAIYYLILKPLNVLPMSEHARNMYDDTGLKCRIPLMFNSWRQYENIHILFWLGKDCAWNLLIPVMWIVFLVPTIMLAFDFMIMACTVKTLMIERAHYTAQFTWVVGNMVWALGEFYFASYDEPLSLGTRNYDARKTPRWWSSWILFMAYVPIVILYLVWIPLTVMGKLQPHKPDQDVELSSVPNPLMGKTLATEIADTAVAAADEMAAKIGKFFVDDAAAAMAMAMGPPESKSKGVNGNGNTNGNGEDAVNVNGEMMYNVVLTCESEEHMAHIADTCTVGSASSPRHFSNGDVDRDGDVDVDVDVEASNGKSLALTHDANQTGSSAYSSFIKKFYSHQNMINLRREDLKNWPVTLCCKQREPNYCPLELAIKYAKWHSLTCTVSGNIFPTSAISDNSIRT
eukprot:gene343-612_t